tara:strand:- start:3522 stop:3830 length:309 start_codon:yes stop_codon:yes gene_type:complete
MAITKQIVYDKKEIVGDYAILQIRKASVIKEDNKEISRSFERYVLEPGTLDASDNLVDNPLDKEPDGTTAIPQEIKDLCAVIWTTSIKNAWKAKLIADKPSS